MRWKLQVGFLQNTAQNSCELILNKRKISLKNSAIPKMKIRTKTFKKRLKLNIKILSSFLNYNYRFGEIAQNW